MSTKSAKKWLVVATIWLIIGGGIALVWRLISNPEEDMELVMTKTVRFGGPKITRYSQRDAEDLAVELADNLDLILVIVGHISPGRDPDGEKKLAEDQIRTLKSFLCDDRGIDDSRISLETTDKPNKDGVLGNIATCKVYEVTK